MCLEECLVLGQEGTLQHVLAAETILGNVEVTNVVNFKVVIYGKSVGTEFSPNETEASWVVFHSENRS